MGDGVRLIVRNESPREASEREMMFFVFLAIDILLFIAALFVFAWFHHARQVIRLGDGIVSARSGFIYTMTEDFTTADDGGDIGYFEFPGLFKSEQPTTEVNGDTIYYKDSVSEITVSAYALSSGIVRVADVYITEISFLQTYMANNRYGRGVRESVLNMALKGGATFCVTGDNYSERDSGVVMRNGVLYSGEALGDVCVLNWDGSIALYGKDEFVLSSAMESGAYQMWSRGPILLSGGEIPASYDADTAYNCRRAALGYYAPGHYCFVITEGDVSLGEMSGIMKSLNCESAYGLYGGRLAQMALNGVTLTNAQEVNQECSDIIMITK